MLAPVPCWADGYPSVDGTTTDGWVVTLDEPSVVDTWQRDDRTDFHEFASEPCEFRDDLAAIPHPHNDATGALVCATTGKSPLTGATYEIRPASTAIGNAAIRLTG